MLASRPRPRTVRDLMVSGPAHEASNVLNASLKSVVFGRHGASDGDDGDLARISPTHSKTTTQSRMRIATRQNHWAPPMRKSRMGSTWNVWGDVVQRGLRAVCVGYRRCSRMSYCSPKSSDRPSTTHAEFARQSCLAQAARWAEGDERWAPPSENDGRSSQEREPPRRRRWPCLAKGQARRHPSWCPFSCGAWSHRSCAASWLRKRRPAP